MTTTSTETEVEAAVARGAELLDRIEPGWAARIGLGLLDMASCSRCVLGQVYGDYSFAHRVWDVIDDGDDAVAYGFEIRHRPTFAEDQDAWEDLERLWADEILRRRV